MGKFPFEMDGDLPTLFSGTYMFLNIPIDFVDMETIQLYLSYGRLKGKVLDRPVRFGNRAGHSFSLTHLGAGK